LLAIVAVLIIIAMIIATVFVASYYYHQYGGQGFLKARALLEDVSERQTSLNSLPMRSVMQNGSQTIREVEGGRIAASVPFSPCGDQQSGCEGYGQPVGLHLEMIRHPSSPNVSICAAQLA
jgi:hypothetical protein